jgi:DNA-binding protein YbaB
MNDPEAALRRLDALARSYPERLAAAAAQAAERGRQQISGTSADEQVTVTADGPITNVAFSATALRRLDTASLGERAAEAINAALDAAETRGPAAESTLDRALDEALDVLNHRLDGVLGQLDEVERSLEP